MQQESQLSRVLIIDDDAELCALIQSYLSNEGFDVESVHDGKLGVRRALSGEHSIAILDVMLPQIGGFDVLQRIRSESALPVIMLTAKGDEIDRVVGLEIGADDYLPKPFSARELVARIRAVLRRFQLGVGVGPSRLAFGDVELDVRMRCVRCARNKVDVTATEFGVLHILLRSAGQVVGRDELYREVLGRRSMPDDRAIDLHVSHLRRKLNRAGGKSERIKTVHGIGYQFTFGDAKGNASQ